MRRRPWFVAPCGFTLLEVMLAVGIGVIFMGGAVVFLSSTGGDKDLIETRKIIEGQAGQAREAALRYGREQRLILRVGGVAEERFPEGVEMDLITPRDLALGRRSWSIPDDYPWLFTGSGLVEPIRIRLRHGAHVDQFSFGALTGETTTEKPDRR